MQQSKQTGVMWSVLMGVFLLSTAEMVLTPAAAAQSNPIVIENQLPGTGDWEIGDYFGRPLATDANGQIKGYGSPASVQKGGNVTFFVSVNPAQSYTIDIYRIGWYQGLGGRLMQHIGPLNGVRQPTCPMDPTTLMVECRWTASYTLATQTSWTTGIYLALLTNAQGYTNYIVFVVRDDSRVAALLYQQAVNTDQAYNDWGGRSLYTDPRAYKVSFDRPQAGDGSGNFLINGEINLIRWLERSGYDVSYSTDVDTHRDGVRLLNYRGFLSPGHDEYWSKAMYDAVVTARDANVNIAFLGANAVFWQVRFEPSSSGIANRVMVCYKDATADPVADRSLATVQWRDPLINRAEQTLIGVQYTSRPLNVQVPYVVTNSGNWVYAGTGFRDGDSVAGIVGYEADRLFSEYAQPSAVIGTYTLLSRSPYITVDNTSDYSNSSVYQAPSGAWVFGSGTISWSWALDDYYIAGYRLPYVDARIQRTMANILNRFVAQGFSISGTISPAANGNGAMVTLTGTASATTAADALGNYSFNGLANGNYTVTPSKPGFTFSPVNRAVTVSGANVTGVNFTATQPVASVTLNPASVTGGSPSTGTVTLGAPAPSGGAVVTLTSGNTAVATVPSSVTVPATQTTATFTVNTSSVATTSTSSISATYNNFTKSATLTVNPVGQVPLSFVQAAGNSGESFNYTVNIAPSRSNFLAVFVWQVESATTPTVTDNLGSSYTQDCDLTYDQGFGLRRLTVYHLLNVPSGITGVSITPNRPSRGIVAEYAGMASTAALDVCGTVNNQTTPVTSWFSTATTTTARDLIFGLADTGGSANAGYAASGAWNGRLAQHDMIDADDSYLEDQLNVAAGSYTATGTTTSAVGQSSVVVAFRTQ